MPVSIRDFHKDDFETLWRIDQQCFAPGISYSRPELLAYMRLAGSFTLLAQSEVPKPTRENSTAGPRLANPRPQALNPQLDHPNAAPSQELSSQRKSEIVAFLVATVSRRSTLGHIITIDVLPEARRLKIGSALLKAAEERLRAVHCTVVRLEMAVNNTAALAFYKRHDYCLEKTIPRYYPDGIDAFLLSKRLA